MRLRVLSAAAACLAIAAGCSSETKTYKLSGNVTFKGQPVPAGYVMFTPDVASGALGQVRVFQIVDGKYDSDAATPPGMTAGKCMVRVAGFDGKPLPTFGQGKQIFNPVDLAAFTMPADETTKDFEVPASAGVNVKIVPTSDPPGGSGGTGS